MSQSPKDVMDYCNERDGYSHYNGVSSFYGKIVDQQQKQIPKYSWPGEAGENEGALVGEHRNTQLGP